MFDYITHFCKGRSSIFYYQLQILGKWIVTVEGDCTGSRLFPMVGYNINDVQVFRLNYHRFCQFQFLRVFNLASSLKTLHFTLLNVKEAYRHSRINLIHRPAAGVYHGPSSSVQVEAKLRVPCNKTIWQRNDEEKVASFIPNTSIQLAADSF
jgi:hypothetical protein